LSAASRLKYLYLAYLSQPKPDRILYRMIRKQKVRHIVEIGIGNCVRAMRLIQVAQRYANGERIHYTGIDLFEDRAADNPGVPLKTAFRQLRSTGARVKLIPGNPFDALHEFANALTGTELLLIAYDQDAEALGRSWFYMPRMLEPNAQVLRQEVGQGDSAWSVVPRLEVERRAQLVPRQTRRHAA